LIATKARITAPPKVSELLLGAPLSAVLATFCLVMLAGWLPHYLTWPWWIDIDALAAVAQEWNVGILPYRDVAVFNFPGQIELLWLLGTSFGWGRTLPVYAADAALLLMLGMVMSAWSLRSFGRSSPGLVGYIAVLHYYLSLDYALVAQRDWQAPLLVVLGMMLVQAWPSLTASIGSGLLFGLALVIRPHALLFAPAVALVVAMSKSACPASGAPAGRRQARSRVLLAWTAAACIGVAVGFAPLVVQGLLGDFVRGLRQASQGRYGQYPASPVWTLIVQLSNWRIALGSALALAVALAAPSGVRRLELPWVLMLLLVLVYRPLHPFAHAYLAHPLWLIWSINLAVIAGMVLTAGNRRPWLALGSIGLLLLLASPGVPRFCDMAASLRALGEIGQGIDPVQIPLGAATHFAPLDSNSPYTWQQYREVLAYLRLRTGPHTQVANLLRNVPFPGLNGTVGRISPLRTDSGIIWLYQLDIGREADFAHSLEAAEDTVVVWIPGERSFDPRLQIPIIERTVTQFYRPEARLSGIQIWRRLPYSR
jgi:hypothetical protein